MKATGSLRLKRGIWQMVFEYQDSIGQRRQKSESTGLPEKGNKRRAQAMLEKRLDEMFTLDPEATDSLPIFSTGMIGQYAHGNEPSHHVAYLYDYIGKPEKTQRYVSEIMRTQYANRPDGLCGNEDCGQMSAWYVFSALGFYPVDPVSLNYAIGTPLFEESIIRLPNGKSFTVRAPGVSAKRYRIEKMTLNGHLLSTPFLTWRDIVSGGELDIVLREEE